jgi:hypothetical protein
MDSKMNERIKELRRQATLVETYTSHDGSVHEGKSVDLEKFAELIVRECGQYLNSPEFIGRSDLDWAMVLNEHFGVEE